jgi:hypothetical protein
MHGKRQKGNKKKCIATFAVDIRIVDRRLFISTKGFVSIFKRCRYRVVSNWLSCFISSLDHIAQIIELVGHFPRFLMRGRQVDQIFNRRGEYKHIS